MPCRPLALLIATCFAAVPLAGHALCTSDGVPPPAAVLERFINADCAECWRDATTPKPGAGTLALDWIVPGSKGDDAPLSAAAHEDAFDRLQLLGRQPPGRSDAVASRRTGAAAALRLAQGAAFNDYIGASIALQGPSRERWQPWLLLVEQVPAGAEGSPVARNLVRNVFRPDWGRPAARAPGRLAETRSIMIREGADPERLRLVGVLHDGRGRIRAIAQTECR
jgi:hypothetical protein